MRHRLIRLNPSHFVVLLAGVALVMLSLASVAEPVFWDLYAREIGLPAMGKRHGFTYGAILFQRDGPTIYGIVDLNREAPLAQLGLRVHDAPWTNDMDGNGGEWAFYEALREAERGEATSLNVIDENEWTAHHRLMPRTIEIPARR